MVNVDGTIHSVDTADDAVTPNTPTIVEVRRQTGGGALSEFVKVDGVTVATGGNSETPAAVGSGGMSFGATEGNHGPMTGSIAEVLIYRTASGLTTDQAAQVRNYLSTKWGVAT